MAEKYPSVVASTSGANNTATTVVAKIQKRKRRRTRSHNSSPSPGRGFFVPGFESPGSNSHKMMSLSELMDAARGVTNMFLAHEIAVDKDFMLEKLKPEAEPGSMEEQVKTIVHQAFWDLLAAELSEEPPQYGQALSLLSEIRETLIGLLLPSQTRVKDAIAERLDLDLIAQQAQNQVLDVKEYALFIIDLMGKLCAPVRDEEVATLKSHLNNLVELFKNIMKVLDNMKLDMANFTIQQARPLIVSQSVEYEKTKFKEFLNTQDDGLKFTREWLQRHRPRLEELEANEDARFKKLLANRILTEAFVELLEWDYDYHGWPETIAMDATRLLSLRDQVERAAVSTAVILLTFSNISGFVIPAHAQGVKVTIKKHIDILLEDFKEDTDLLRILPNVALQVIQDINDYLKATNKDVLPESTQNTLKDQIAEMEDPNHRIRDLVQRRIVDFHRQAISASRSAPLQIPPGLTLCQKELAQIAGSFVRLIAYNRSVFGEIYTEIIENHVLFKPNDDDHPKQEE